MEKTVNATEAVRRFSEILNSVKYQGAHYTILRGGRRIASISPADIHPKERTLGELKALLREIPALGNESVAFDRDLKEVIMHQPSMPE